MAEERVQRRLAAILAADVVGYSRLVEADEAGTVARLKSLRTELIQPMIAKDGGRVVKVMGDGVLVEFGSAVDAVRNALAIQSEMTRRNANLQEANRIEFRVGINVGDVIIDGKDIQGDGVNVAARLESLAEPAGICISGVAYDHVAGKIEARFEDLGPQAVKNITRPIRVLRVLPREATSPVVDVSAPVPGFQGRPAIAVLPLQNLSGDPDQEHFADGIAEDILTRLAMWRWCPVIARNSSFAYKGQAVDIRRVGKELGARYVLEGSVRKAGGRARITAQLIDAETGHHVWADRYDRTLNDIFAVQDEITDAITLALEPAVGRAEMERARLKPPASLDAWELYQRGLWHFTRMTKEDFALLRDVSRRAIALDPLFSGPRSTLAMTTIMEVLFGWSDDPRASLRDAYGDAETAVSLDPVDAWAYAVLSICNAFRRQHGDALAAARRASELNPSFAFGRFSVGTALVFDGNAAEAVESIKVAIRLSANDTMRFFWHAALGFCQYMARDYEEALESLTYSVRNAPYFPPALRNHACVLAQLGRIDEARAALNRFVELSPGFSIEAARRAVPLRNESDFEHLLDGLRKAGWEG